MLEAALKHSKNCDIFIGVAAVADYRPAQVSDNKIKKNSEQLQLTLIRNPDIISAVAARPRAPFMVGFAAETDDLLRHGRDKLQRKRLQLLFANDANDTFNSDSITATALWADGEQRLGPASKTVVAMKMLALIHQHLHGHVER